LSAFGASLSTSNGSGAVDWEHQSILVILGQDNFWKEILRTDLLLNIKLDLDTCIVVIDGILSFD
jgi:hypothetical protein